LVTGSAVAWSSAGFFTRLIHLDAWTVLAWRGIFGAFGVAAVVMVVEGRNAWLSIRALGWPGWLFAIVGSLCMVLFITALRRTTVAHVAVIYATAPFFAGALSWVCLGEAPSRSAIQASLGAFAGVSLMVGLGNDGALAGDILALGMTAAMAGAIVIARRFRDIPGMTAAGLATLLSGLVSWPFGHPTELTGAQFLLLAAFGLVNSALGLAFFALGARLLPPMETALIGALEAPLAPLWVWAFFAETPSPYTSAGGFIVFTAVAVHLGTAFGRRQGMGGE
jgi:drug/metabolite transporter (DMT)-like permease